MERQVDYDRIAPTYDRRYEENRYQGTEQALFRFVGDEPGLRVAEVGCGTGQWLSLLRERGLPTWGLDASFKMLSRARTRLSDARLVQGEAGYLPWPERVFDRLFCINAFHHFPDKRAFLSEARRVLRKGGSLMIVGLDPHTGFDQWYIYDYFESSLEIDKRRYPSSGSIEHCTRSAGFEDCSTFEADHLLVRLEAREALERGLLDKSVTSQLSVLTDEEYERGIQQLRAATARAEAQGQALHLLADLRIFATTAHSR